MMGYPVGLVRGQTVILTVSIPGGTVRGSPFPVMVVLSSPIRPRCRGLEKPCFWWLGSDDILASDDSP